MSKGYKPNGSGADNSETPSKGSGAIKDDAAALRKENAELLELCRRSNEQLKIFYGYASQIRTMIMNNIKNDLPKGLEYIDLDMLDDIVVLGRELQEKTEGA